MFSFLILVYQVGSQCCCFRLPRKGHAHHRAQRPRSISVGTKNQAISYTAGEISFNLLVSLDYHIKLFISSLTKITLLNNDFTPLEIPDCDCFWLRQVICEQFLTRFILRKITFLIVLVFMVQLIMKVFSERILRSLQS